MAQYEFNPEEIRQLMRQASGTNLAGQSMAGPVATGQAYAQSIAGGMPMEQVIAPGVSYSPGQSGGYTQADLDFIARGPAPVMPIAPTTGETATIDDQMSYAPVGTPEPTPFSIGDTLFPNVNYLQGLDFSGIPGLGNIDVDAIIKEYQDRQDAGEPEPFESFFTDFSPVTSPSVVPTMPEIPDFSGRGESGVTSFMPGGEGVEPLPIPETINIFGKTYPVSIGSSPIKEGSFVGGVARPDLPAPEFGFMNKPTPAPVVPFEDKNVFELRQETESMVNPYNQLQGDYAKGLFDIPDVPQAPVMPSFPIQQPMNFTGLPNMPVIPQSIAPTPVIPQIPVMPRIPQTTYIPPASSFIQPRVEEIVSPIRSGSPRNFQQPGLFNLV